MSNDFYNTTGNPVNRSFGYSALMRTEFANIATGFDKLPAIAGNGYKLVVVSSGGTGLTAIGSGIYGGGNDANNTAYSPTALQVNVYGSQVVAIGTGAMVSSIASSFCTAIGYRSQYAMGAIVTAGSFVVGKNYLITTVGTTNFIAIGAASNTVGLGFTASGVGTGDGQAAQVNRYNTSLGCQSLIALTHGDNNTAVGMNAGSTIATGMQNTMIGSAAAVSSSAAINQTALGYNAAATADNQVMLGNTSVTEVKSSGKFTSGVGTGSGTATLIGVISVNTTAVGNVGAGTDDLMTYTLPANSQSANGKGVRVTAWGSTAAVAGAKTIGAVIGSTVIASHDVSAGAVIVKWHLVVEILRTGANAQICTASFVYNQTGFGGAARTESVTSTEVDTAAIILKVTGNSANAANNDIVQTGMLVEFIN